jgi:uncharacterized protein YciI
MYFVIHTVHAKGATALRAAAMQGHQAYLARHRSRILAVGSLLGDKGALTGALCIIEADNLLAAIQFVEDDPMTVSGAPESIDVTEWRMAGYNREYPLPV